MPPRHNVSADDQPVEANVMNANNATVAPIMNNAPSSQPHAELYRRMSASIDAFRSRPEPNGAARSRDAGDCGVIGSPVQAPAMEA